MDEFNLNSSNARSAAEDRTCTELNVYQTPMLTRVRARHPESTIIVIGMGTLIISGRSKHGRTVQCAMAFGSHTPVCRSCSYRH